MSTYQHVECHIQGIVPTIMNNGRKANPLDEFARGMKQITSGRKRGQVLSEDLQTELARLEFMGALYVDKNGAPCWPGENLESMMLSAAKKFRRGDDCKVGLIVDGNFPLIYKGPKDVDELWQNEGFRKICMAKPQGKPVLRCRPIFSDWELKFVISHDPEVLDVLTIRQWLEMAGARVGLSDWRPKFGRFVVVSVQAMNGKDS